MIAGNVYFVFVYKAPAYSLWNRVVHPTRPIDASFSEKKRFPATHSASLANVVKMSIRRGSRERERERERAGERIGRMHRRVEIAR
jgi:hypothetical protein